MLQPGLAQLLVAVAGLWTGTLVALPLSSAALLGSAGIASIVIRRPPSVRLVGVAAIALACGSIVSAAQNAPQPVARLAANISHCHLRGVVLEERGGLGTLVAARVLSCSEGPAYSNAGIVVFDGDLGHPGSGVTADGYLFPLGRGDFDEARRATGAQAVFEDPEPAVRPPTSPPLALAAHLRQSLAVAASGLEPNQAALLRGLAVGDTSGMDDGTVAELRNAGLSHLVAVSGSNVAIVLGCTLALCGRLSLRARTMVGLLALGLYVLVTGPDASVLRAAAMGAVALLALLGGARVQPLNALALALIVLLALRPSLALSVGLELSAAATAGIVLFGPPLLDRMRKLPTPVGLAASTTVAAQVAVAPLLVVVFGQFSITGPVANLLAAPAVAPPTILGLLAGCVGEVAPSLGQVCALVARPFLWWILTVGHGLGGPAWAAAHVPHWTGWVLALPVSVGATARLLSTGS